MAAAFATPNLFTTLFELLPTGVLLLAPCLDEAGQLVDFTLEAVNPAGQRALGLPAQPDGTLLRHFLHGQPLGDFARYQQAYLTDERLHLDLPYQADGLARHYQVVAQRSGEHLLLHFANQTVREPEVARPTLREPVSQLQAGQQPRARHALLGHILGELPLAVATLRGPTHCFSFVNARYQALVSGRARLGASVAEVLPEAVEQGFLALLDHVYHTGESYVGTEIAILLDQPTGPPRQGYFTFTYQPLRDEQDRVEGVLASVVDVTAQVQARKQRDALQQALLQVAQRQAQQRQDLLRVFTHAPVAVALLREPDHRFDYWNDLFEELFPGARAGATLAEALPALATPAALAELDRLYQGGATHHSAVTRVPGSPDAAPRYVTFTYQAYREQQAIAGVAVFAQEVTGQELTRQQDVQRTQVLEQRVQAQGRQVLAAQAELERQYHDLTRAFEQAPVAFALFQGPDLVVTYANPEVGLMLGRPVEAILGRPVFEAVPDMRGQGLEELMGSTLAQGTPHDLREVPVRFDRAPGGRPAQGYFDISYRPQHDEQGRRVGVVCVGIEVTGQVQARRQVEQLNHELERRVQARSAQAQALNDALAATNEELQATNEELQATSQQVQVSNAELTRANADLDTFVYTASHDLKAPITNVEGILMALREELPPAVAAAPTTAYLLDLMSGALQRFQTTLGHLTTFTHQQAPDAPAAPAVDVAQVVEGVRLDLEAAFVATRATLAVDVADCAQVHCSPKLLRSAVFNLVSNALKYRAPERVPHVQVRARCLPGQQLVLTVQDNGLGLTEAQQHRLFQLFQRLHAHVEGAGVGLYALKRLVDHAGGTISVASTPEVGSTFTLTLPLPA